MYYFFRIISLQPLQQFLANFYKRFIIFLTVVASNSQNNTVKFDINICTKTIA